MKVNIFLLAGYIDQSPRASLSQSNTHGRGLYESHSGILVVLQCFFSQTQTDSSTEHPFTASTTALFLVLFFLYGFLLYFSLMIFFEICSRNTSWSPFTASTITPLFLVLFLLYGFLLFFPRRFALKHAAVTPPGQPPLQFFCYPLV